jgi:tetratricopeptide (TPR) repeat protein
MSKQAYLDQLKELLIKDELGKAIEILMARLPELGDQLSEAELMQYAARLSGVEREKNLGIIPAERYNIERNQLRQILIQTVTKLQTHPVSQPVVTEAPKAAELLVVEAAQHYSDGEYRAVEPLIRQAINSKELNQADEAEAYAILGNSYNELGLIQDAIDAHQKALELNPDSVSYWTNLGICYRLTSQYDKAEACYQKALSLDPEYAQLYTSLGALYLTHTMEFEKAIEYLEKAIALDPGQAVAYANMAIAKASVGFFDEADALLKQAVMKGYRNAKNARKMIDNLRHL